MCSTFVFAGKINFEFSNISQSIKLLHPFSQYTCLFYLNKCCCNCLGKHNANILDDSCFYSKFHFFFKKYIDVKSNQNKTKNENLSNFFVSICSNWFHFKVSAKEPNVVHKTIILICEKRYLDIIWLLVQYTWMNIVLYEVCISERNTSIKCNVWPF